MGMRNNIDFAVGNDDVSCEAVNELLGEYPVECDEPPALSLDETGYILKCSKSCEKLFGYRSSDLSKLHISCLIPQLSGHKLVMDGRFNPMLDFLCHCGHLFLAQNRQGDTFKGELSFVRFENEGRRNLRLIVRPLKTDKMALNRAYAV